MILENHHISLMGIANELGVTLRSPDCAGNFMYEDGRIPARPKRAAFHARTTSKNSMISEANNYPTFMKRIDDKT